MKRLRLLQWSCSLPFRRPIQPLLPPQQIFCRHHASAAVSFEPPEEDSHHNTPFKPIPEDIRLRLPSPPVDAAKTSAKLSALHARLSLPSQIPLETLARTLVDASADSSPRFNNKAFSVLGSDLLNYYTSEYIICQYPRLPLAVVFAAMWAYVGSKALAAVTKEWGVEFAAAPGGEVDPGLLQFKKRPPDPRPPEMGFGDDSADRPKVRESVSKKALVDDAFGEMLPKAGEDGEGSEITEEKASMTFVRALMGAIYLHAGRVATKQFYRDHFMSRQLNVAGLFAFKMPTRDLNRLCAREGFRSPVARILSETGRRSRHPVFIVGVFSGNDKLGEGAGSSLDEARTRAAVAALKAWYLYSPPSFRLPSETEESGGRPWNPALVDPGNIIG